MIARLLKRHHNILVGDNSLSPLVKNPLRKVYQRNRSLMNILVKADPTEKYQKSMVKLSNKTGCFRCNDCNVCNSMIMGSEFPHPHPGLEQSPDNDEKAPLLDETYEMREGNSEHLDETLNIIGTPPPAAALKNDTVIYEFVLLGLSSFHSVQVALFMIFLFMYFIIIVANSLIILATATDSNLHTPMYFFLTNLSIVDILFSSSILPRTLRDLSESKKTILFGECVAQMYIAALLGITECFLLVALGYDRYMAICFPLHYTMMINRASCLRIAAGTWVGGFVVPAFHVILIWNVDLCGNNVINHFFCEVPEILALACGNVTVVELMVSIAGIIALIIPVSFIVVTYIKIIRAILNINSSAGRKKTFSTCISHIIVVTMFYGSVVASYMKPKSKSSPDTDKIVAIFYTIVTPMINPLVYTLRNKDVKSALKKKILTWSFKFNQTSPWSR
ncbi:olfactory receptor 2G3-like [Gastrophryne carolinensis]